MRFSFYSGPWENSVAPTIVRDDPEGGDPHILAVLARIHKPGALHELCRLANSAQAMREALGAIDAMPLYVGEVPPEHVRGLAARYQKALSLAAEALGREAASPAGASDEGPDTSGGETA